MNDVPGHKAETPTRLLSSTAGRTEGDPVVAHSLGFLARCDFAPVDSEGTDDGSPQGATARACFKSKSKLIRGC